MQQDRAHPITDLGIHVSERHGAEGRIDGLKSIRKGLLPLAPHLGGDAAIDDADILRRGMSPHLRVAPHEIEGFLKSRICN